MGRRTGGSRGGLGRLAVAGTRLPAPAAHVHGVPSFEALLPALPAGRSRVDGMRPGRTVPPGTPVSYPP
ncbi:hypothetical protein GTY54_38390 [Streptomyces sp. SID625]|nr:hypothetical protein [Streptomyces sp. SID625]